MAYLKLKYHKKGALTTVNASIVQWVAISAKHNRHKKTGSTYALKVSICTKLNHYTEAEKAADLCFALLDLSNHTGLEVFARTRNNVARIYDEYGDQNAAKENGVESLNAYKKLAIHDEIFLRDVVDLERSLRKNDSLREFIGQR